MQIIALDYETFFDKEYTLKRLTQEHYIRDPRFSILGCAVIRQNKGTYYEPEQFDQWVHTVDWTNTAIVCHHAQFDALILSHHYGVRPRFIYCTLSMARLVIGNHLSLSLDSLARHFGLAPKSVPYNEFRGKRWDELDRSLRQRIAEGAVHDCELTLDIFKRLLPQVPTEELYVIDQTVRMFTEPALVGDISLLAQIWEEENVKRVDLIRSLNLDPSDLHSTARFTQLLEAEGVEIQYKNGPKGPLPAVAKTDDFMKGLCEDDNPKIQALARARLGLKSTLVQTRAEALGHMASRGPLTVYLRYCGAHTTRWSGGDAVNFQNLRRGHALRRALMAPDGFQLAVIDLCQIECRMLATLAKQEDLVEQFRNGIDIYSRIASEFYRRPVDKSDPAARGVGKQLTLSCGYGCGARKFRITAAAGTYGPPVRIDEDTAAEAIRLYRRLNGRIVQYWNWANYYLQILSRGGPSSWGPMTLDKGRIYLPNGAPLIYDTIEWHQEQHELRLETRVSADASRDPKIFHAMTAERSGYRMKTRHGYTWMYGAKLVENVVQALARLVLSQAMLRINAAGLRILGCSHDEIWVLIPNECANEAFSFCMSELKRPPEWLPDLPLDCEGHLGTRYEK